MTWKELHYFGCPGFSFDDNKLNIFGFLVIGQTNKTHEDINFSSGKFLWTLFTILYKK